MKEKEVPASTQGTGHVFAGRKPSVTASLPDEGTVKTSLHIDRGTYEVIKAIAAREGLSLHELEMMMFRQCIDLYEKKHGKVEPLQAMKRKEDLF